MANRNQERTIIPNGEFITLGQMLKAMDYIQNGGDVRYFLAEEEVWVNGEPENRRGKKLRPGDVVEFADGSRVLIVDR